MLFYIDPGTGSMLFTVLIGVISALIYGLRGLFIKLKYSIGGKKDKSDETLPFVIYSDDKRYYTTFKGICDEFEKKKTKVTYLTQSKDDPIFNENYKYINREFIGEGNKAFTKLNYLKADVVLSTTPSLDVYQWKRSKDVKWYTHIYHSANDCCRYRMFGIDYYDAIICAGNYYIDQIRQLEEKRNLPNKELLVFGVPYLDALKNRLEETPKLKKHERTVLLAPSWGPSSILNKYGSQFIDKLIETGYKVIVRPHPQSFVSEKDMLDKLMASYPQIEFNRDTDNFDVLNKSDILISDFSGVMFDFALVFDKPIIYAEAAFDNSIYDAWWIDEELWTFKTLPEIGVKLDPTKLDNIKTVIDTALKSTKLKKARELARKETWANEGNCAKLTVNYLIKKQKEITAKKETVKE